MATNMEEHLHLNHQNIKDEVSILVTQREKVLSDYDKLIKLLSKQGASKNAADFIFSAI